MAIQTPTGYELTTETSEGDGVGTLYSYKRPDGSSSSVAWTWKLGCIDAMWKDVRDLATSAHVAGIQDQERLLKTNVSFAIGYLQGKTFVDAQVRVRMAQAGYTFGNGISAIETIEKLLVMLNGPR